ncbi:hypothetical protein TRVA0_016S00452 [Trichomonascus vanleenenianus]|uniref:uncharacterized protein n=1 Tax=Trichomonascus vanleenenianus TaxID=2268995 RepID=UPI003ECAD540
MLQRRRSQRSYSLTTAYTGVQTPPPNAISVNPAARAAAASVGDSRSNSMSSNLSSAAAAAALKRHNSLTQESMAAMEAASAQAAALKRRNSASGRSHSMLSSSAPPPALVVSPPTSGGGAQLRRSASTSSTQRPPPTRTSVLRTRNPDRSESLTTTTVRRLGSFELTSTRVINLPSPKPPQPLWGRAPPSPQTSTSSSLRKPHYASSLLSFESDLEPVTEEDGIDQRLSPVQLKFSESPAAFVKHRPPPRSLSPIKPALKDSSRTASIASGSSNYDESPKRTARVSFSEFQDVSDAPDKAPKQVPMPVSEGATAKLRYQRQQIGIANAAKMAFESQTVTAAANAKKRNSALASSSAAAFAASTLHRSNSAASRTRDSQPASRSKQKEKQKEQEEEDSDNDSVYSDAFEEINDRSIDDTLAAAAAAAAEPKSVPKPKPKSKPQNVKPLNVAQKRSTATATNGTVVKTLRQTNGSARRPVLKVESSPPQPQTQDLPSPPVSPIDTYNGIVEGVENGYSKKQSKVFRFNAFKPKKHRDSNDTSDDADAESIGSESSWKRERQQRRKSSTTNGGGFTGFRKVPLEESAVDPTSSDSNGPAARATENEEPTPLVADGLTAEQLAAIMYKQQVELDKEADQSHGRSSFERNDVSSSPAHFKFSSMRSQNGDGGGDNYSQPVEPVSQYKSRFEESDSDDDYALPPLPEHRAFLEKPKHVNTGNTSAASKIMEVFSPSKEAKILIPRKKNSAANLKPVTEDAVVDPSAHSMPTTLRNSHLQSSRNPEPLTLRTGGLADNIPPRRKKKFNGLRKVFGLAD